MSPMGSLQPYCEDDCSEGEDHSGGNRQTVEISLDDRRPRCRRSDPAAAPRPKSATLSTGMICSMTHRPRRGSNRYARMVVACDVGYDSMDDVDEKTRNDRRFNKHGDLEQVVSITTREDKGSGMALATFRWEPLEEYLAAGNASLVRMLMCWNPSIGIVSLSRHPAGECLRG